MVLSRLISYIEQNTQADLDNQQTIQRSNRQIEVHDLDGMLMIGE
ncbi:hypothetical protein ACTQ45_10820 [Fundicoccus sp. Sow4_D5]